MKIHVPLAEPQLGDDELHNVTEAVKSGWVSSKGKFVDDFEKAFSIYVGTKHGVATSNGTVALHLALSSLGIRKHDRVLVPSLTFVATANAITYTGAKPVFVDSSPKYWCIDPDKIEDKVDKHTKAIIVVHLYGHPCNMDKVLKVANEHGLAIVEDCAQAHGAEYKDKKVGSFGIISCFSFYGNKIITTGEGGMCLTNDGELADKMRILRDHGMNPKKKYWHDVIGFNYRMTNLQAALGVAQLKKINRFIAKKRRIASTYKKFLQDLPEITVAPEMPWARNVYWLYSILTQEKLRDNMIDRLLSQGIETRPFFYPTHILPPYRTRIKLRVAEELSARGLNLPSGCGLSENQILQTVASLRQFLRGQSK